VKQLLATALLQVSEAVNGQDGYALSERGQPTAILLDLEMPEMSGFDMLARLKHNPTTQAIPVIIHSSKQLDAAIKTNLVEKSITILGKETTVQATDFHLREALIAAGMVLDV
jgi:CheY-like chemotaxis protein